MKKIEIEELSIGDVISRDIYNDQGSIILPEGTKITSKHIVYLMDKGYKYVYLDEPNHSESYVFELLKNEKTEIINIQYEIILNEYKYIYNQIQSNNCDFDANILTKEMKPLVDSVIENNDILGTFRLVSYEDSYNFTHPLNVSMLGAMIAKWLNLSHEEIQEVALVGLLHDIGKTLVPQDILFKSDPLTDSEFDALKAHAKLGYDVLKTNPTIPKSVLAGVLLHHERCDGNGYPNGLTQSETPLYARIIAVADVFDALTSDKIYRKRVTSFSAFKILREESFSGLDPNITEIFLANLSAYFVNNKVRLSDNRIGEVVYINKFAVNRPLVKIQNEFIDLASDYSLDIIEVF